MSTIWVNEVLRKIVWKNISVVENNVTENYEITFGGEYLFYEFSGNLKFSVLIKWSAIKKTLINILFQYLNKF